MTEEETQLLQENLNQLEDYIRSFWEFIPIPICYLNPAFNIIEISKSFEKLSGFSAVEVLGESIWKYCSLSKEETEKEILKNKAIFDKEAILFSKDKREISVSVFAKPREDEEKNIIGYFFAFLDLSERKRFEEELKKKIEELEKFEKIAVKRELRMIELKKIIAQLQQKIKLLTQKLKQKND
jgi:PAS domain S-box-containing protein